MGVGVGEPGTPGDDLRMDPMADSFNSVKRGRRSGGRLFRILSKKSVDEGLPSPLKGGGKVRVVCFPPFQPII